jgi:hypothetical protein
MSNPLHFETLQVHANTHSLLSIEPTIQIGAAIPEARSGRSIEPFLKINHFY